jgi:uncharacterized protein YjiS (DUF1127 family)
MTKTIADAVIAATTGMLAARRVRRRSWMLHELSDAQLKDIGLTRYDIGRVTRHKASWPAR